MSVEKIATPRGAARSMTSLTSQNNVNVNPGFPTADTPGEGSDWFSPLAPMPGVAPKEVAGRQFDFRRGWNLQIEPRVGEPIGFRELRALADYDVIRIIIERRKDQLCRVPWTIRAKHEGKRPKAAQLSTAMRSTIAEVTDFFRHPSDGLNFRSWLKMLVEDLLVLDAPALYCERTAGGHLVALSPVDGALIKPVIGDDGRMPRAFRWSGEPFTWLGQTVDRQNFAPLGFKIVDGLVYPPSYVQILKGLPATNMTSWDLLYRPMCSRTNSPYGRSPVENIALTTMTAMRRATSQFDYFAAGSQPDAMWSLPSSWNSDQVQRFQDYFDGLYSGNLANRRKLKFIPSEHASPYTATKEPPLKNEFDEWLARICCFAFSYPPQALLNLSNKSTAEQHEETAEEEGLGPLKEWACELFNEVIEREFDGGEEVEFAWLEEQVVDQKVQADVLTKLVGSGILSVNQAREKLGEEPDPNPAASQLAALTQTGFVPIGTTPNKETNDDDAQRN
jgi:Phage portal protein